MGQVRFTYLMEWVQQMPWPPYRYASVHAKHLSVFSYSTGTLIFHFFFIDSLS